MGRKYNDYNSLLVGIADAIRSKLNITNKIKTQDMPELIESIQAQSSEAKSITMTMRIAAGKSGGAYADFFQTNNPFGEKSKITIQSCSYLGANTGTFSVYVDGAQIYKNINAASTYPMELPIQNWNYFRISGDDNESVTTACSDFTINMKPIEGLTTQTAVILNTCNEIGYGDNAHQNKYDVANCKNDIFDEIFTYDTSTGVFTSKKLDYDITLIIDFTTYNYSTARSTYSQGQLFVNGTQKLSNKTTSLTQGEGTVTNSLVLNVLRGDTVTIYTKTPNSDGYPKQILKMTLIRDVAEEIVGG